MNRCIVNIVVVSTYNNNFIYELWMSDKYYNFQSLLAKKSTESPLTPCGPKTANDVMKSRR